MNIFALDASNSSTSLAIRTKDNHFYKLEIQSKESSHSENINSAFKKLLVDSGLNTADKIDIILVGKGPGSFTGLRISFAYLKGLASALKIPLIPICSFASLAYSELTKDSSIQEVIVISDARRKELFFAKYDKINLLNNEIIIRSVEDIKANIKNELIIVSIEEDLNIENVLKVDSLASKQILYYLNFNKDLFIPYSIEAISLVEPTYIRKVQALTIKERAIKEIRGMKDVFYFILIFAFN